MLLNIITTDRCYLREWNLHDSNHLFDLNNDPEVLKYTGDVAFNTLEEAKQFVKNYDHFRKWKMGRWAVFSKTKEEFLGWCGLKYHFNGAVDLGFRFHKKNWNMGFATECGIACLNYGFENLHLEIITAKADAENIYSIKLIEKLGFQFDKERITDERKWTQYTIKKNQF